MCNKQYLATAFILIQKHVQPQPHPQSRVAHLIHYELETV